VKVEDVGVEITDKKNQQDDKTLAFLNEMEKSADFTIDDLMKES
jgi:hypothetical protein